MSPSDPPIELVVTKLWPPASRSVHVARARPLDLLRAGEGRTLTLVDAPAGSGKTTAVAQWLAADADRRPGCWFSVDRSDNDPTRFWTYVIMTVRQAIPGFGDQPLSALSGSVDVGTSVLPALINELAAWDRGLALVIDDYHLIANPAIHWQLEHFLERLPERVQVVLSTRVDPPLPLSRWRGRGQLAELRAAELRFEAPEAEELFGRMDLGLASEDVTRLLERTEGWAAGLSLAGLSVAGREDPAAFVRDFAGTDRHVVDYLATEVLERQPPEAQRFLVRCSVLSRLSGRLCDAVLERPGSARVLADLEHSNAFVMPLGHTREWYRLHHLFAEVLANELRSTEPALIPALHRRASRWYGSEGLVFEAVEHAVEARDARLVADLLMPVVFDYVSSGQGTTVLGWLDRLGEELVASESRLCLSGATASLVLGEGPGTARWLDLAERRAYDGPLPGGPASIDAGIAAIRGVTTSGRVLHHLDAARTAVELSREDTSPWRLLAQGALGLALYWSGEPEQARPWIEGPARLAPPLLSCTANGLLAMIAADAGDPDAADRFAGEGRAIAREHHLETSPPFGRVLLADARVAWLRGALPVAASSLEQAVEVLRLGPYPYETADALLALAEVRHLAGAHGAARAALFEARTRLDGIQELGILRMRWEQAEARLARPAAARAAASSRDELSSRELEVLRMLPSALSEAQIGEELFISYHTAHSHIRAIYRKLGTTSRAQTVERGRATGLLPSALIRAEAGSGELV